MELEWDGSGYTATLTDHNRVLSDYSFSANEDGISFSVNGNQLIITATDAPSDSVRITAIRSVQPAEVSLLGRTGDTLPEAVFRM